MTVAVLRDILQTLNEAYSRSPYELRRTITGVALTIIHVDKYRAHPRDSEQVGRKRSVHDTHTQRSLNSDTQSLRQRNSLDISDCQSGEESSPLIDEYAEAVTRSARRLQLYNTNKVLTHQSPVHSIICNYYAGSGDQ